MPNSALRGFTERVLLAFETLQFPLRLFKLQNFLFEPGDVRISASQFGAPSVQSALKFAHLPVQAGHRRFKRR